MLAAFRRADFFSLRDAYVGPITDSERYVVSIEFDGRKKTVDEYAGFWAGKPDALDALETELFTLSHKANGCASCHAKTTPRQTF